MKHRTFAFLVLLLALASAASAATTTWAATETGPYKSTDGGATWQPVKVTVSNGLLQGIPSMVAIAVDPVNPSNVYFVGSATGTTAFFKSADAGQTWSGVLVTGLSGALGYASAVWICIDPVATNNIYISDNKTFHSTDSGATWTEMSLDSLGGLTGIAGLATDPKISGVVYAAVTHGKVAKSTDFGVTWKALGTLATSSPTNGNIFVDPRNSQNLYVSRKFGQGCAADCAAFRSTDGGLTWQNVAVPAVTRTIDFDRTNGDIYAGGLETGVGNVVLKSSDQGVTWAPVAKGFGGVNDGPAVSVDPGATGNVYALGDSVGGGSLQKTTDGGTTWKNVTLPPYCTPIGPNCPIGIAGRTPAVYMLAYESPPAQPAVSVATMVSAASGLAGPVAAESIVVATGSHIATGTATGDLDQPPMTL
ncbi:MAG TPA: sialidase family protein, partial [Candidatus Binataceae bacterium]|nr:sialidase family protein [Candidatus Binataceae bacterium]